MPVGLLEMQSSIDLAMNLQYIVDVSGYFFIVELINSPHSGERARLLIIIQRRWEHLE